MPINIHSSFSDTVYHLNENRQRYNFKSRHLHMCMPCVLTFDFSTTSTESRG